MKIEPTYTASIYVGCREGYSSNIKEVGIAKQWLQALANKGGICVTVLNTEFIYKDGNEPGFVIGLINYPRFPESPMSIRYKALKIAYAMLLLFKQSKVSVVFPDDTIMLEEGDREYKDTSTGGYL